MKPKAHSIWFSDKINPLHALTLTQYQRSQDLGEKWGFIRELGYTKLIRLDRTEEEILASFSSDTRRLVRRAAKENISFTEYDDLEEFVRFFNLFAKQKGLAYVVKLSTLEREKENLCITKAVMHEEILFSHLYRCDKKASRVTLLYGGSVLKDTNKKIGNSILSSANRGLHYFDMCLFSRGKYKNYDLGGYAFETENTELKKINAFKDEFGGEIVCEANYQSYPLHVASSFLRWIYSNRGKVKSGWRLGSLDTARNG